jgi:hypothetical protein
MPKRLRKETANEVDDCPLVYNARDYNIHHREIRAIQRFLVGSGLSGTGVSSGNSDPPGDGSASVSSAIVNSPSGENSINDLVSKIINLIDLLLNRGYIGQYTGTVQSGGKVKIPPAIVTTQTVGGISAGSTSIPVVDTSGFPSSGVITKFNSLGLESMCSDDVPPTGGRCNAGADRIISYDGLLGSGYHATNQEVISYASKTTNSFEGCTRGVNGSTSQDVASGSPALVACGRAAVSFTHNFWGRGESGVPNQFYLTHDASLTVVANLLDSGSRTRDGTAIQDHIEIGWILTVSGYFEDTDVSQILSVQE